MKYKYITIKSSIVLAILIIFSCSNNDEVISRESIFDGSYDNLEITRESFEKIGFKFNKDYNGLSQAKKRELINDHVQISHSRIL